MTAIFAVAGQHYSSLLDAFFFGFLGFLIYWKTSRIAAAVALFAYIGERFLVGVDQGLSAAVNVLVVVIFFASVFGCRGAFVYHNYVKKSKMEMMPDQPMGTPSGERRGGGSGAEQ
jgi:hypothetical protein